MCIYRHLKRDGKLYELLVETLESPTGLERFSQNVPPGGIAQFLNFGWPPVTTWPAWKLPIPA